MRLQVFKRHAVLQASGSRGRASYLISRSVGFYVFNGIGPNATSRHVRVPNSVGFLDDAVVRWTAFCGFARRTSRASDPSVGVGARG